MNQILQFLFLFGVIGVFFVIIYATVIDSMTVDNLSQQERVELFKTQTLEQIKLIEIITVDTFVHGSTNNTVVDLINIGEDDIRINKFFVNGVEITIGSPTGCVINVRGAGGGSFLPNELPVGKISNIECTQHGKVITIITQNDKIFKFGDDINGS